MEKKKKNERLPIFNMQATAKTSFSKLIHYEKN